jgi:hypothetical protein
MLGGVDGQEPTERHGQQQDEAIEEMRPMQNSPMAGGIVRHDMQRAVGRDDIPQAYQPHVAVRVVETAEIPNT